MTYGPYCNPVPLGHIPFPITGEAVALVLLGLLLISAAGILSQAHPVREGRRRLTVAWSWARGHASGYLQIMEARGFLRSARSLMVEGDFLGAENELEAAARDAREAHRFLPRRNRHLSKLMHETAQAARDVHAQATRAVTEIKGLVARNENAITGARKPACGCGR